MGESKSSAWARKLLYERIGGDPESCSFEELSCLLDEVRRMGIEAAAEALRKESKRLKGQAKKFGMCTQDGDEADGAAWGMESAAAHLEAMLK